MEPAQRPKKAREFWPSPQLLRPDLAGSAIGSMTPELDFAGHGDPAEPARRNRPLALQRDTFQQQVDDFFRFL
jgi:hypothetical protein